LELPISIHNNQTEFLARKLALRNAVFLHRAFPVLAAEVVAMNCWLIDRLSSGDAVLVPAIVYYKTRRELLRARKVSRLARLDAFVQIDSNPYLALSDEALRLAAELWHKPASKGAPLRPRPTSTSTSSSPPRRSLSASERRSLSSPQTPVISASLWTHAFGMT
jgi:hypothetical protein